MECDNCGKKLGGGDDYISIFSENIDEKTKHYCTKCYERYKEQERKKFEEMVAKVPKIKCPYCEQWFPKLTNEQYRDSAELNVLKWVIVPAWGLAGSLKNKPYIECPRCKMKIMQG
jgi:DNA-directed RNA polymerase subunit RPC12/RpoP